jgi:hypothetical protein
MPGGDAADFELTLSAADVETFVNGYGIKPDLIFECHRDRDWYDDAADKGVATAAKCQLFGALPGDANDGGCGVGPTTHSLPLENVPLASVLALLCLLALRRGRKGQAS